MMFSHKYMFGMLAGLAACLFSVSSVGQTYPFDSVRPIVTLQTEQAPDSQFLAVSMNYLGRKGQAVYASLDYLKNRGWFSGITGKITLSDLQQDGANNLDAIRWNSATGQWEPQPINSFEFVDTTVTITVCNNIDSCDHNSFQAALQQATRLKAVYDTVNANTKIRIVQRPNPDGSRMLWNVDESQLSIEGGDYSGIFISSEWQDSVYTLYMDNYIGNPNASAFFVGRRISNLGFEDLSVADSTGTTDQSGLRIFDSNGITFNNVYLYNFANTVNVFRGAVFLAAGLIDGGSRGVWNQNGYVTLIGTTIRNCSRGIENRGVTIIRNSDVYNNNTNVEGLAGFVSSVGNMFALDTMTTNLHVFLGSGAIFTGSTQTMDSDDVNVPFNTVTDKGTIYNPAAPYPFQESTTAAEPAASSGIRYYFNTDDNNLKITYDTTNWLTLGVLSALTQNSQAVEAAGNSLQINNVGLFRAGSDGNGTAPYEFSGSTFQAIPTVVEKDDPNGRAALELQYGAFEAVDTSGSYVLERLAKPYLIQVDTINFGNTADGSTNSVTVSVPGAEIGRAVTVNRNGPFVRPSHVYAYVSAADTVEVTFLNLSGSAIDPAAHPFTIAVSRYGP